MDMTQHLPFTMPKGLQEQACEQRNNLTLKYVTKIFQKSVFEAILVGSTIHTKMYNRYGNNFSGTSQWTIWEYVEDTVNTQQYEVSRWTFATFISAVACPHVPHTLTRVNHSLVTPRRFLCPPSPLTYTTGHNQSLQ